MRYNARQRLLETPHAKNMMDGVATEAFLRGAEAALLDMLMQEDEVHGQEMSAARYHRLIGARDYLRALLAIAEPPKPPAPKPTYGLNRDAA